MKYRLLTSVPFLNAGPKIRRHIDIGGYRHYRALIGSTIIATRWTWHGFVRGRYQQPGYLISREFWQNPTREGG